MSGVVCKKQDLLNAEKKKKNYRLDFDSFIKNLQISVYDFFFFFLSLSLAVVVVVFLTESFHCFIFLFFYVFFRLLVSCRGVYYDLALKSTEGNQYPNDPHHRHKELSISS